MSSNGIGHAKITSALRSVVYILCGFLRQRRYQPSCPSSFEHLMDRLLDTFSRFPVSFAAIREEVEAKSGPKHIVSARC